MRLKDSQTSRLGNSYLLKQMPSIGFVAEYVITQIAIQALSAICGILLVRSMPKSDFGWYTISFTAMSTMGILADSGLGSAFSAIGGRLINKPLELSAFSKWIQRWRVTFLCFSSILVLPLTAYILIENQFGAFKTTIALALLFTATLAATESVVFSSLLRLQSKVLTLQKIELTSGFVRLFAVLLVCLIGMNCLAALTCMAIALWAQRLLYNYTSQKAPQLANTFQTEDWTKQTSHIVRKSIPLVAYSCLQGYFVTAVLAVFAGASEVADYGALARFSILFTLVSIPFTHFAFPAISRANGYQSLSRAVIVTVFLAALSNATVAIICALCRNLLLPVLGGAYTMIGSEFYIYMLVTMFASTTNIMWGVILARGWVALGWLQIALGMCFMAIATQVTDVATTRGALLFGCSTSIASFCIAFLLIYRGLVKSRQFPSEDNLLPHSVPT